MNVSEFIGDQFKSNSIYNLDVIKDTVYTLGNLQDFF